jgi:hypothetical protein
MPKSKTSKAKKSVRAKRVMPATISAKGDVKVAPGPSPTKLLTIIAMLRRPEGATIAELAQATGWKPNSIRGAISGCVRKRRLMKVIGETHDGVRTYRIVS